MMRQPSSSASEARAAPAPAAAVAMMLCPQACPTSGRASYSAQMITSGPDEPALAVVPATRRLDLDKLRRVVGSEKVEIAREAEFQGLYPDCDLGAMPPFGELYGQRTFIDETLREEERIAFHAGDHRTAVEMSYSDFERLCQPVPADLSGPLRERV